MSAELRVGVLGASQYAMTTMIPAMMRHPRVQIVGIGTRDRDKAQAVMAHHGLALDVIGSYEDVMSCSEVDAVYVPLPASLHSPVAHRALERQLSVLVEKPAATTRVEAVALAEAAKRSGVALVENLHFPRHPQLQRVRQLIDSGALGSLRSIAAWFTVPARDVHDIRYRADLGGGALLDVGVYPIRAATSLLGDDLLTVGATLTSAELCDVDLFGSALLVRPTDGVTAAVGFGLDTCYRSTIEVTGSHSRVVLNRAFTARPDESVDVVIATSTGQSSETLEAFDQPAATLDYFIAEACRPTHSLLTGFVVQARLLDEIRVANRSGSGLDHYPGFMTGLPRQ